MIFQIRAILNLILLASMLFASALIVTALVFAVKYKSLLSTLVLEPPET